MIWALWGGGGSLAVRQEGVAEVAVQMAGGVTDELTGRGED